MRRMVRSEHSVDIDGYQLVVTGQTGPFTARWRVDVEGREVVNEHLVRGRRTLDVPLPDGSSAQVEVCCAPNGSATMEVRHDGRLLGQFSGTVA